MNVTLLTFTLVVLSTARLTRLVVADKITEPLRVWVVQRLGVESAIAYLVSCTWCVSIYTSAGVTTTAWFWADHPAFLIAAIALSASHITGLLSQWMED